MVQNIKTGKQDTKGVITEVRVADDGTVSSYDLMTGNLHTSRHRRFARIKNASEAERTKKDL